METEAAGPSSDEAEVLIRLAEEALHQLRASFAAEAGRQLAGIQDALDRLTEEAGTLSETRERELFDTVFRGSHEIKGQAGSFGYDLITHVCDSLCHVVEMRDTVAGDPIDAIRRHLDAARLIFDQDLRGDGGATGVALLGDLGRLRSYSKTPNA